MKRHLRDYWPLYALIAYIVVGIGVFGHGAHRSYAFDKATYDACTATELQTKQDGHCNDVRPIGAWSASVGLAEGVVWPLYVSWVYFDNHEASK